MYHTYVKNIFGERKTLDERREIAGTGWTLDILLSRQLNEVFFKFLPVHIYLCCCASFFTPFLRIFVILFSSPRGLFLQACCQSTSWCCRVPSWKVLAEAYAIVARTCDVDRIRIRPENSSRVVVWDNKLKCAHTRDSFSSTVLSVRISYSFLLKFSFLILEC